MNVIATVPIPAGTFGPDEPMVLTISKAGATPPAPQPALALIEDELKQLVLDALEKKLEAVNIGPYGMHKGDWRQLRQREIADAVVAALARRFKGE